MTPVVYISFSQPCCWFLQLLSFSPPFILFGPQTLNSFVHISETRWALPYRVWRQSPWICVVFVWCGSGPVLCCFAVFLLAKRKSGREICGSSLLPCFLSLFWLNHDVPRLWSQSVSYILYFFLPLLPLSGPSLRARSATTEGKKIQLIQ